MVSFKDGTSTSPPETCCVVEREILITKFKIYKIIFLSLFRYLKKNLLSLQLNGGTQFNYDILVIVKYFYSTDKFFKRKIYKKKIILGRNEIFLSISHLCCMIRNTQHFTIKSFVEVVHIQ